MRSLRYVVLAACVLAAGGCKGCGQDQEEFCKTHPDDVSCPQDTDDTEPPTDDDDTEDTDTVVLDTQVLDTITDDTVTDTDTDPGDTVIQDTVVQDTVIPTDSDSDTSPPTPPVTQDKLVAGDLAITELQVDPAGCARAQGQYIEIKNLRAERVNLKSLRLRISGGASLTLSTQDVIVDPGGYAVAETSTPGCPYSTALVSNLTFPASSALTTGGQLVELRTTTNVTVDAVNFAQIHLGSSSTVSKKGYAVHLVGAETAAANDSVANWCMADSPLAGSTGNLDHGTPFARAITCYTPDSDSDSDTSPPDTVITDDTVVDSPIDTGPFPSDTEPCTKTVDQLVPGDLVVTEIMLDPTECMYRPTPMPAEMGRWVELRNVSGCAVDLNGLVFKWGDDATSAITVNQATTIPPGRRGDWVVEPFEYFTLQRELSGRLPCHPYGHEFGFGNALSFDGRKITVRAGTNGVVVDTVDFTGFDVPTGRSLGLDRHETFSSAGAVSNDDPLKWCPQNTLIKNASHDLGTPNAANRECGGGPGDSDTSDTSPSDDTCKINQLNTGAGNDGLTATELCPGDLMITEVMVDPLTCSKSLAQYVEVKNTTDFIVYPKNLVMQTKGATTSQVAIDNIPLVTETWIPPRSYGVVMMYNLGVSYCHDGSPDMNSARKFRAKSRSPATEFQLAYLDFKLTNGQGAGASVIDHVDLSQFQGIVPSGEAIQLKPGTLLTAEGNNDKPYRWCWNGPVIPRTGGSLDHGTPGAPSACDWVTGDPPTDDSWIDTDTDTHSDTITDDVWPDTGRDTLVVDPSHDPLPDNCPGTNLTQGCLKYGDLVITEVMFDPIGCAGGLNAKYIEVFNRSNKPIDPRGMRVRVGDLTDGTVDLIATSGTPTIGAGKYGVLRIPNGKTFCYQEGAPQLKVAGIGLDAVPTILRLFNEGSRSFNPSRGDILVDQVDMRNWQRLDWDRDGPGDIDWASGFAIQLNPTTVNRDPDKNDDWASWCPSGNALHENGAVAGSCIKDYGSPTKDGTLGEGTCGTFHPTDTCLPPPSCPADKCVNDLVRGDLVITEIQASPNCDYHRAEFVEIFNATGGSVELKGLQFRNNALTPITVTASQIVPSGKYAVFTSNGTPRCYAGTTRPEPTAAAKWNKDTWNLSVPADSYKLYYTGSDAAEHVIDQVATNSTFPARVNGHSWNLSAQAYRVAAEGAPPIGSVANDNGRNWCVTPGEESYRLAWTANAASADFATPGASNDPCIGLGDTDTGGGIVLPSDDPTDDVLDSDVDWDPIDVVAPGKLVVTEIMVAPTDCSPQSTAEYIEVYNASDRRVNLRYLELAGKHSGVNYLARVLSRAIVEPHAYAVLANVAAGANNRCYGGLTPTGTYGKTGDEGYGSLPLADDGESFVLRRPDGVTLDKVDYTALPRQVGRAWELTKTVLDASLNDDPNNWCLASKPFVGSTRDLGSPGAVNSCAVPVVDTDTDSKLDSGTIVVDSGTDTSTTPSNQLEPGDLVITEFLAQSAESCGDAGSEWFEVRNVTDSTIDLYGLRVEDASGGYTLVLDHVLLAASTQAAFARYDAQRCYLDPARVSYAGLALDNGGDLIRLRAGGSVIDEVDFRTWPSLPKGAALQLDPDFSDADSNDQRLHWCVASRPIPGAELDKGSPDRVNPSCSIYTLPTDTDPLDGDETDNRIDTDFPYDSPPVTIDPGDLTVPQLQAGNLVISEILSKPVACGDTRGEYFELYNATAKDIDLFGLVLKNGAGRTATVSTHTPLGTGRYAIVIRTDASPQCYDLQAASSHGIAVVGWAGFGLADTGDTVTVANATRTIDSVNYGTFPVTLYGASWNLDVGTLSAVTNDFAESWCASTQPIPTSPGLDLGTPGFTNERCSVPIDTDTIDTFDSYTPQVGKPVTAVQKGELLISELHVEPQDCGAGVGQYIELYNHGTEAIDLDELVVGVDNLMYQLHRVPGRLVLQPGEVALAERKATVPCYPDVAWDWLFQMGLPSTGGVAWIADGTSPTSRILDLVDYRSFPAADGAAWMLRPERYAAPTIGGTPDTVATATTYATTYGNNAAAAWCAGFTRIPGSRSDRGSPGIVTPRCLAPGEDPRLVPGYVSNIDEVRAGELVISEFMPASRDCSDIAGEYVEILNTSPYTIDLSGLIVKTTGGATTTSKVTPHVVVAPGETVLGRRADTASGCYVAAIPDFVVPGMSLDNNGGTLEIWNSHSAIDVVDYTHLGVRPGKALAVVPGYATAGQNDNAGSWCYEPDLIEGSTRDHGTPGVANTACTLTAETKIVSELEPGDLIVAEYLYDSSTVDCPAGADQFVEVENTSPYAVNVRGLRLHTRRQDYEFSVSRVIDAGAQAVLFIDLGCLHYRVPYDVKFADVSNYTTLSDQEWMQLRVDANHDGTPEIVFDEVDFNGTGWPAHDGRSLQLVPGFDNADDNDDPANWCVAQKLVLGTTATGGTPRQPNDCSPQTEPPVVPWDTAPDPATDTGYVTMAIRGGSAKAVPNGYFTGKMHRAIATVASQQMQGTSFDALVPAAKCAWEWTATGIKALPTSGVCPTCDFAFEVRFSAGVDRHARATGQPSVCGHVFDPWGGVSPMLSPTSRLYFSEAYDALYLENTTTHALEPYADPSPLDINYTFSWRGEVYARPVP